MPTRDRSVPAEPAFARPRFRADLTSRGSAEPPSPSSPSRGVSSAWTAPARRTSVAGELNDRLSAGVSRAWLRARGLALAPLLLLLLLLLLTGVIVRAAWMADDAYITLRVVDNFWNGYGLRWNIVERVQVFTHPLWMLLLTAAYGLTREAYFTTLVLSALCLAGVVWLLRGRLTTGRFALALLMMATSRAFVDYSTSGLENPLSHLLLVSYCLVYLFDESSSVRLRLLALLAAACALTRLDLAILVVPSLGVEAAREGWRRSWKPLLIAAVPVLAWHLFALIYFGSLFPNTAYAKLSTGIPRLVLMRQGWLYLHESLLADFVTLPAIVFAIGLAIAARRTAPRDAARVRAVAAGLAGTLLYVVAIGGDFMSGRFLTAPFIVAVSLSLFLVQRASALLLIGVLIGVAGALSPRSPLHVWLAEDDRPWSVLIADPATHGIVDERRVYYWSTGLLNVLTGRSHPSAHPHAVQGTVLSGLPHVRVAGAVGLVGYGGGPSLHIIDPMALTDAFLAREPVSRRQAWTIGHFVRDLPDGYQAAVERCMRLRYPNGRFDPDSRVNCLDVEDTSGAIADARLRARYRDVCLASQAPLFTIARWRAIARLGR